MNVRTQIPATRFMGEHVMKMDIKGRFSIPSVFVDPIDRDFIFYKTPNFPVIAAYAASDIVSEEVAALLCVFSKAVSPDVDKRMVLPQDLRMHIGLEEHHCTPIELTVIGTGRNFHIMTVDSWQQMRPMYEKRLEKLLSQSNVFQASYP